jgi:hypothetical protein
MESKMSQPKTIEDLKTLRAELVERRHAEAYSLGSAHHQGVLEKLVLVHQAISALDAVIAEGRPGTGGVSETSLRIL